MDRLLELWCRWMQDQKTATIIDLIDLAQKEINRRREAEAFRQGTEEAMQQRLTDYGTSGTANE